MVDQLVWVPRSASLSCTHFYYIQHGWGAGLLLPGGSRARVQVESLRDALQHSPVGVSGAGLEASSDVPPHTDRFAVRSDE